ncbi:DUF1772 domain-containing protein [Halioxenophilus aromaticivorans]|uniref:DUF1772 domain-containing protein n=1 Tax=Halioxenophilus aromaticivorans TaxID=1306992 RepID=A0AAV3U6A7_9ALTE
MLIALTVMTGIMAGIYAAFSLFVMRSLAKLDAINAGEAMVAINQTIVKTLFVPLFFGSVLLYAYALVDALVYSKPQATLLAFAAVIYLLGMFVVTLKGNVPMNNRLQVLAPNHHQLREYWPQYAQQWSRLNHIRTVSSALATTLLCNVMYLAQ